MNLKDFIDVDITKLPTEILTSINIAISTELGKRRINKAKVASNLNMFAGHPFIKQKSHHTSRGKYYTELMSQDWSHLFSNGDLDEKYYVYAHINPCAKKVRLEINDQSCLELNGQPFYIGKGCGNRAYDLKRNQGHGKTIKDLLNSGVKDSDIVTILYENLSEDKALEIESKLIYFFGSIYESGRHGILVNLDIPPRPDFHYIKKKKSKRT